MKAIWKEIWAGLKDVPEFPYFLAFLLFSIIVVLMIIFTSYRG